MTNKDKNPDCDLLVSRMDMDGNVIAEHVFYSDELRKTIERYKNDLGTGEIMSVSHIIWSFESCVDDDDDMPDWIDDPSRFPRGRRL